jgi:ATP-dependent Clp protease ATP-binding subunit ClpX
MDIAQKIRACGYVGQERAVKAISLFAYRHLVRLKRIQSGQTENIPKKTNMLFAGPTGCGKTHLVELLFSKILDLPTVVIDITNYTETGYCGQDLSFILTRLLDTAGSDTELAETGIVCLDEFDKIANSGGNNYVTDAGNQYVKGLGVQRELLKMVEGVKVSVPLKIDKSQDKNNIEVNTANIPFIACGAFSGLKNIVHRQQGATIGFLKENQVRKDKIAISYTEDDVNMTSTLQRYGFLPELIGRFSRIVPFDALGEAELRSILKQNVMPGWKGEMTLHEIDMVVDDSLIEYIVASALKRETGGRSVETAFTQLLEDAAYDAYSSPKTKRLTLNLDQGRPGYRIEQ